MLENESKVLARIRPDDLVLDVGGWACPFNRANWIIDVEPYDTRGFYASVGLPRSQGGKNEYFNRETWVTRDLCAKEPWPFVDKQFDFSICSHTLEDLRDPLYVCSEIIRVSKAGYIEVPSRLWESCRGIEHPSIAGLSHHRWLVELENNHLKFTQKYHLIHAEFDFSLPSSYGRSLSIEQSIVRFYWSDKFTTSETIIHGADKIHAFLAGFVGKHMQYSAARYWWRSIQRFHLRVLNRLKRVMS